MRKIIICIFIFFAIGFFLPQILSTSWSKKKIEVLLEHYLGGRVQIEKIALRWHGQQSCQHVQWIDEKNGIALYADSVLILSDLLDCLKSNKTSLNVLVKGTKLSCQANFRLIKKKKRKDLQLHFSPIEAMIKNKIISFQRTEIDVAEKPELKIITWGQIDLNKKWMDMTLALPPPALKKLFKAKELPEDYLLEIPISSELSSRSLEKKLLAFFFKNYATVISLHR